MKKLLIILSTILALMTGHLVGFMTENKLTLAAIYETRDGQIIRDIPTGYKTLHRFERVIVDGDGDEVQNLYNRIVEEVVSIPDVFIDLFNRDGFTLIIAGDRSKYTKQVLPEGFTLGGVMQLRYGGQIIIFPTTSAEPTSLYHELGHAIESVLDMERKTLPAIWEFDREGAIALTGWYAGTSAEETWAESFEFLIINKDDPEKMAEAERLIPVSYRVYERLLEYGEKEAAV